MQSPYTRRRFVLISLTALLALSLVAGGTALLLSRRAGPTTICGQQVARVTPPAPTATPGIPNGFTQFRDPYGIYALQVPGDWRQTVAQDAALADFSKDVIEGGYRFDFTINASATTCPNFQSLLKDPFATGPETNEQGPTSVQLAGETWVEASRDTSIAYTPSHEVIMATQHGSVGIYFDYFAPISQFAAVNAQYFRPMLGSFYFLS